MGIMIKTFFQIHKTFALADQRAERGGGSDEILVLSGVLYLVIVYCVRSLALSTTNTNVK